MGTDYFDSQHFLEEFNSKNGDALRLFYNEYWEKLYAYARRLTQDPEEARDQAQEAFVKLYARKKRPWECRDSILKFLYTTIRNGCIDYFRKQERASRHAEIHTAIYVSNSEDQDDIENAMMEGELMDAIFKNLSYLPEKNQQVLKLLIEECKTYREVATIMNISVDMVKYHRSNSFRKLKDLLTNKDVPAILTGSLAALANILLLLHR